MREEVSLADVIHPLEARVIPGGLWRTLGGPRQIGSGPCGYLSLALRPVPDLELRAGDLVFHAWKKQGLSARDQAEFRCSKRQLTRAELPIVADNLDAFQAIASSWDQVGNGLDLEGLESKLSCYVNDFRALRCTNDRSVRLWRLRSYRSDVSHPIEAGSAEAAIFELLQAVNCVPPTEGNDNA